MNSQSVLRGLLLRKDCSNAFKETLVEAYDLYCRANNVVWKKPFYERYDKMPKIPSEEKLNMIIAKASKNFALILSMMKDLARAPRLAPLP